jgi:hypothetical protein
MNFRMLLIPTTKIPADIKLLSGPITRLLQRAKAPHPPGAFTRAATRRDYIEPELNGAIDNSSRFNLIFFSKKG